MPTTLAFRTPVGGVSVPAGQSKQLGTVDVHNFSKIRVVADERVGSPTGVTIRLTITEGNELVAQLDTLSLAPHSQLTRLYDVPGPTLTVFADAIGGAGNAGLDVPIAGAYVLMLEIAPQEVRGANSCFTGGAFRVVYHVFDDLARLIPDSSDHELSNVDVGTYTEEEYVEDMGRLTQYRCDPDLTEILIR